MTKRYEFTGKTKILYGKTLHEIRALISLIPFAVFCAEAAEGEALSR